jgi:(R)-amidase
MDRFTLSVVQFESTLGPPDDGTLEQMIDAVSMTNTDLVVFPELVTTGYYVLDDVSTLAEPVPGPTTEVLGAAAESNDTAVLFGMLVQDGEFVYNSAIWLDPDGTVRTQYDKRHCWGHEQDVFSFGEEYAVVDAPFGRIGLQICYDLNFPASTAALARAGCDVLVNISAWTVRMERDWQTLLPARAIEQGSYVVGCNQSGTVAGRTFCGHSAIYEPDGTTVIEMGDSPGQVSMTLDPDVVAAERRRNPMRKDRLATEAEATDR